MRATCTVLGGAAELALALKKNLAITPVSRPRGPALLRPRIPIPGRSFLVPRLPARAGEKWAEPRVLFCSQAKVSKFADFVLQHKAAGTASRAAPSP